MHQPFDDLRHFLPHPPVYEEKDMKLAFERPRDFSFSRKYRSLPRRW